MKTPVDHIVINKWTDGLLEEKPDLVAVEEPLQRHVVSHHQRGPPWVATAHTGASPPLHVLYCVYLD